jgi:molybdopterin-containing oxidoreductase family iron-sulfur binding subunit
MPHGPTRRDALALLAAQLSAALAGCSKPDEEIVPYVRMPERLVPGEPLRFATTLPLAGYGTGVLAISIDGRPIKVEGNPRHPESLGATDVFAEAAVLSLYDPDRSQTVLEHDAIASWDMLLKALLPETARWRSRAGEGVRLLTGRVTSPTMMRQIDELLTQFPAARWHGYEPVDDEGARAGAILAHGRPVQAVPQIDRARVALALDADPLGPGPDSVRSARGWISQRKPDQSDGGFSRWYVIEAAPTLTGVKADQRLALAPPDTENAAIAVANALGAGLRQPTLAADTAAFVDAAVRDLTRHRGEALVLAGRTLSGEAHALVHWINNRLDAPMRFIEPVERSPARAPASLAELAGDLDAGRVDALVVMGANPAYDAAPELRISESLGRVRFSLHCGLYRDETAELCGWHVPASHPLESWSDLRAADGTASIVQPLIRPLYGTRTAHELLAALTGRSDASSYDLVRATWSAAGGADFEGWWRRTLEDGVVADSAAKPVSLGEPRLPEIAPRAPARAIVLVLAPDASLWDGTFANNAWLQECPKPVTKEVWGNALGLAPADAQRLGLSTGDLVDVAAHGQRVTAPVIVTPGHAAHVASLTLGHGRARAGAIGNHVGVNAYTLRTAAAPWVIAGVTLAKANRQGEVLVTQNDVRIAGDMRDLYPSVSLAELRGGRTVEHQDAGPDLYPDVASAGPAWAMVIDTQACIGCNACVVACQAENNIPVVGPDEIARGRDMHWLRVDIYDRGTPDEPQPGFQPVPCMHCEKAPCEPVCPVAASVHDREGLNVQVYNRCIGTRFCQANCPYKVRRFNFFGYADGQEYADLGAESLKAQKNPDVTVRTRGVMEKCTYCVQRISRARRAAEREDRKLGEGEVVTACQAACPTRAIAFGDLNRPGSAVRALKSGARHYALLGHLGTRPRTTYLAEVKNPAREGGAS